LNIVEADGATFYYATQRTVGMAEEDLRGHKSTSAMAVKRRHPVEGVSGVYYERL